MSPYITGTIIFCVLGLIFLYSTLSVYIGRIAARFLILVMISVCGGFMFVLMYLFIRYLFSSKEDDTRDDYKEKSKEA